MKTGIGADSPSVGPLAGLRVLDFTTNVSGSYGSLILAQLGAQVTKIEKLGLGDDARHMMPQVNGWGTAFVALNRLKRSIAVNLKMPQGREIGIALAGRSDVVIENMRPGKMEALGLGFEALSEANQRLVYCSISGFGQSSSLANRPTYDMIVQARTGIMAITGHPDGDPVRVGPSIIDLSTGMWAGLAIAAALWRRDSLQRPQHLDVAMFDAGVNWMTLPLVQLALSGQVPQRMGGQTPLSAPADIYETTDGHVVMAILNDQLWRRFCGLRSFLMLESDERFGSNPLRVENRHLLTPTLQASFRTRSTAAWLADLRSVGVPCEPVNGPAEVLSDEAAIERGLWAYAAAGPFAGQVSGVHLPIRDSIYQATPNEEPAPALGEHTVRVLRDAGYSETQVSELIERSVVATPDRIAAT